VRHDPAVTANKKSRKDRAQTDQRAPENVGGRLARTRPMSSAIPRGRAISRGEPAPPGAGRSWTGAAGTGQMLNESGQPSVNIAPRCQAVHCEWSQAPDQPPVLVLPGQATITKRNTPVGATTAGKPPVQTARRKSKALEGGG